jgi:4a-hydroxytetrahydrobiopterin dehydratase
MTLHELAARTCRPLPEGTPALGDDESRALLTQLGAGWAVAGNRLRREYGFSSFATARAFVTRIGAIADEQDHHPDVHLSWGKAVIELWTHTVGGLSENDFITAARFDTAV